jgi:hypothetical protein
MTAIKASAETLQVNRALLNETAVTRNPVPGASAPGAALNNRNPQGDEMSEEDSDFTTMTDPEFLAERARVRAQLQCAPENAVTAA